MTPEVLAKIEAAVSQLPPLSQRAMRELVAEVLSLLTERKLLRAVADAARETSIDDSTGRFTVQTRRALDMALAALDALQTQDAVDAVRKRKAGS
jgi:hypothetical protein